MKKLKFLCLVLLLLAMSITCFAGCRTKDNTPDEPTTFSVAFSVENSSYGSATAKIKDGNSISSGSLVAINTQVVFIATPNSGYSFLGWFDGETKVSDSAETTVSITKNLSYVAKFTVNSYNLTVSSEDDNKGTVSGSIGSIAFNSQVSLTATPKLGYSFEGWYDGQNKVSDSASYTFDMPAKDYALVAKFVVGSFNLSVSSEDSNKGSVSGDSGNFAYKSNVSVTATANNGYYFDGWYNYGGVLVSSLATFPFEMPSNNYVLVAKFSPNTYLLKFSSEDNNKGTVSSTGIASPTNVLFNSEITVVATPKTGYSFEGWYLADGTKINGAGASYTFNMPLNGYEIIAKFSITSNVFNFSSENSFKGSVSEENGLSTGSSVDFNTQIVLHATPNTGYEFDGWYINGTNKIDTAQASYSFKMPDSEYTLVAKFIPKKYTLNFNSSVGGSVNGSVVAGNEIDFNSLIELIATPETGYDFDGWYDGTTLVSSDAEYTFNMPAKINYSLVAKFKLAKFVLNFTSEDTAKGAVSGNVNSGTEVEFGKNITLTATPKKGYNLIGWFIGDDNVCTTLSYDFNMFAKETSVQARFAKINSKISFSAENGVEMGSVFGVYDNNPLSNNQGLDFESNFTLTATANEGYIFDGWYDITDGKKEFISISAEHTFTMPEYDYSIMACFTFNKYTLNFASENVVMGTVSATVNQISISNGSKVEYKQQVNLTASEKFGYNFDGWYLNNEKLENADSEFAFNMPNSNYSLVAKFVPENRVVTFYDGNVIVLSQNISYNTALSSLDNANDFSTLTKDGYSFLGWTTERNSTTTYNLDSLITENLNLFAKWQKTTVYFTVEFRYEDNSLAFKTTIEEGRSISQIPAPKTIEGYEFTRWYYFDNASQKQTFDKDLFIFNADTIIYAEYNVLQFEVTFNADNNTANTVVKVDYSNTVARPAPPTKEGFDFIDWFAGDYKFQFDTPITSDLTLTAKWQEIIPDTFKVNFYNEKNGTLVHTETVNGGEFASIPTGIVKNGYKLDGWFYVGINGESTFTEEIAITSNMDVYAKFSKLTFKVYFKGYDSQGNLGTLKVEEVAFEESATAPNVLNREGYTFDGWDKEFSCITEETTINAKYKIITYNVSYYDGDNKIGETISVEHGSKLSVPENPEKERYKFVGWFTSTEFITQFNFAETTITKETSIYAKFEQEIFTVRFIGFENVELSVQDVRKSESAQAPSAPVVEGYTFNGWDKEFSNVNKDIVIMASYVKKTYTVSFYEINGDLIISKIVEHGMTAASVAPTAASLDNMIFIGWDKNIDVYVIKEDTSFTAKYKLETRTVTFYLANGEQPYHTATVEYGKKVNLPNTPTQVDDMIFKCWTTSDNVEFDTDSLITTNIELYAKYEKIGDGLTVTFKTPDGVQFGTVQVVQRGGYALEPKPYADGYIWCLEGQNTKFDFENTQITENTVIVAVKVATSE